MSRKIGSGGLGRRARWISSAMAVTLATAVAGMMLWTGCTEKEDSGDTTGDEEKYPTRLDYDPETGEPWTVDEDWEDDSHTDHHPMLQAQQPVTEFKDGKYYKIVPVLDQNYLLYATENGKTTTGWGSCEPLFGASLEHKNGVATLHTGSQDNLYAYWLASSRSDGYFGLCTFGIKDGQTAEVMFLTGSWNDAGWWYVRSSGGCEAEKETNKMWRAVVEYVGTRYETETVCLESWTYSSGEVECLKFGTKTTTIPADTVVLLQSKQYGQYIWIYDLPYNNTSWLGLTSDKDQAGRWKLYEY